MVILIVVRNKYYIYTSHIQQKINIYLIYYYFQYLQLFDFVYSNCIIFLKK